MAAPGRERRPLYDPLKISLSLAPGKEEGRNTKAEVTQKIAFPLFSQEGGRGRKGKLVTAIQGGG